MPLRHFTPLIHHDAHEMEDSPSPIFAPSSLKFPPAMMGLLPAVLIQVTRPRTSNMRPTIVFSGHTKMFRSDWSDNLLGWRLWSCLSASSTMVCLIASTRTQPGLEGWTWCLSVRAENQFPYRWLSSLGPGHPAGALGVPRSCSSPHTSQHLGPVRLC